MSSITQTIPTYNGGISQQPDELKVPGQLRVAKNVLPDVTLGLTKRPGSRLIKSLSDDGTAANNSVTNGKWFHYYRDEDEQYIGQIARDGTVKVWGCNDGLPRTVTYNATATQAALKAYLEHYNDSDLQTLTLNDYTYVTNRATVKSNGSTTHDKTTPAMATLLAGDFEGNNVNKNAARPPEAFIDLKKIVYASQYSVNLFDDNSTTTTYTATRLDWKREVDSSNSCNSVTDGSMSALGRFFPDSGTLPGSTNWTYWCGLGWADEIDGFSDSFCPNVQTRIFHIDHGDSGDAADANGTAHTYTVTPTGGSAGDRKDLFFRLQTTGQPVPEGGSASPHYHCRYTTTIELLNGGQGWRTGDFFYIWMKNAKYKITVEAHSTSVVKANLALGRPEPTPFDTDTAVTADAILGDIRTSLLADSGGSATAFAGAGGASIEQIGTGLYITKTSGAFNISTPSGDNLNVMTDTVNDVAELPTQCKHGYVVRIAHSSKNEDDYYVKFYGHNNIDGDGVWEECPKPGVQIAFDKTKMPIQIVRQANGSFEVNQIDWETALVGDTAVGGTNPQPSFIGQKINKMLFFRNRLVLLSDENVIMSKPGDFYNFWAKTALTFTPTDVIDISCSSDKPAIIYDGIQVNSGLVLFTKTQQFMLTTDSDVLTPQTAKINALANYNFNYQTNPISLGTTIGFLDNAGRHSRFWEVARVLREGEPDVIEQSKLVDKLFNKDLRLISNSRENQIIFFSEKNTDTLYVYRYYTVSNKRLQQSWVTWTLPGKIQHHAVLDDALFVVLRNNSKDQLVRIDIKIDANSATVTDDRGTNLALSTGHATATLLDPTVDDITYRIHIDTNSIIPKASLGYSSSTQRTGFTLPKGYEVTTTTTSTEYRKLVVYCHESDSNTSDSQAIQDADLIGSYAEVTLVGPDGSGDYSVEWAGDWTDHDITFGYLFDMEVKLPTIHYTQTSGDKHRSELQGSLVLHRLKFNLGNAGLYQTLIQRTGKPDYTETWEVTEADSYDANKVGIMKAITQTVPVYEKNTNLLVTLKSTHPSPTTLYSMTWEGDYTNKFYRRV